MLLSNDLCKFSIVIFSELFWRPNPEKAHLKAIEIRISVWNNPQYSVNYPSSLQPLVIEWRQWPLQQTLTVSLVVMPVWQMMQMCNTATRTCSPAQQIVKWTLRVSRRLISSTVICSGVIGSRRLKHLEFSFSCSALGSCDSLQDLEEKALGSDRRIQAALIFESTLRHNSLTLVENKNWKHATCKHCSSELWRR